MLNFLIFSFFLCSLFFQNFGILFLVRVKCLGLSQKKILHFFRIEKQTHRTDKLELSQGMIFVFGFHDMIIKFLT